METIIQGRNEPDEPGDRQTIALLKEVLLYHNNLYYNGQSIIEDEEYDMMFRYLQRLEAKYPDTVNSQSPTQTVGARV